MKEDLKSHTMYAYVDFLKFFIAQNETPKRPSVKGLKRLHWALSNLYTLSIECPTTERNVQVFTKPFLHYIMCYLRVYPRMRDAQQVTQEYLDKRLIYALELRQQVKDENLTLEEARKRVRSLDDPNRQPVHSMAYMQIERPLGFFDPRSEDYLNTTKYESCKAFTHMADAKLYHLMYRTYNHGGVKEDVTQSLADLERWLKTDFEAQTSENFSSD